MTLLQSVFLPLALLLSAASPQGFLGVQLEPEGPPTVKAVIDDTPAAKAGLRQGDVFLAVNGEKTSTVDAFIAAVREYEAGDRVRFDIRRDGRKLSKRIRLGELPEEAEEVEEEEVEEAEEAEAEEHEEEEGEEHGEEEHGEEEHEAEELRPRRRWCLPRCRRRGRRGRPDDRPPRRWWAGRPRRTRGRRPTSAAGARTRLRHLGVAGRGARSASPGPDRARAGAAR